MGKYSEMTRSERRRELKQMQKTISKMSLGDFKRWLVTVAVDTIDGVLPLLRESLYEEYGFGKKRADKVIDNLMDKVMNYKGGE